MSSDDVCGAVRDGGARGDAHDASECDASGWLVRGLRRR